MSLTSADEDAIARKVDMELKKGGTFDKIRKQGAEHVREAKTVQQIEKEMLEKVEEIMKTSANLSREEIQRKVREVISNDEKMQYDINSHTRTELNQKWVLDILNAEIEEKVVKQLEDIP